MPRILKFAASKISGLTTDSQWTSHFQHMLPVHRQHLIRTAKMVQMRVPKVVDVKDRIKWWNIVAGDQIRVRGDRENTLHTVAAINRYTNRVHLEPTESSNEETTRGPHVHYSKCQLYLGDYQFPAGPGSTESVRRRVFARRIGTSPPKWVTRYNAMSWKRYAVATEPFVPSLKGIRTHIPWPKPVRKPIPPAQPCDTSRSVVARVTWRPPPFPVTMDQRLIQPPLERDYLATIMNGRKYKVQHPAEIYLAKELSNPHGFAKRLERWQTYQSYKKTLQAEFIQRELRSLNGRTESAARLDAIFKCKLQLEQERKQKVSVRKTFGNVKLERKTRRKARKQQKMRERLTNMVLPDAENQYMPGVSPPKQVRL